MVRRDQEDESRQWQRAPVVPQQLLHGLLLRFPFTIYVRVTVLRFLGSRLHQPYKDPHLDFLRRKVHAASARSDSASFCAYRGQH